MKKLPQNVKTKLKTVGIFVVVGAVLFAVYAYLEDSIKNYFTPSPERADKTPPVTASATVDNTAGTTKNRFLGDQIISLQEAQDYTLTIPPGAVRAEFQAQENPVLLRLGGSALVGGILCEAGEVHELETLEEMQKAVFRSKTGVSKLIINYYSA